jgi:tetratricopeptide (TPR) repeat protein
MPTAIRLYGQALGLGDPERAPDEAARLHLARALLSADSWDLAGARGDLDAAEALIGRLGDPLLGARLLVIRGGVEQKEGDVDRAVATLTEAAECYRAHDDAAGLGEALRQRGFVELFGGRMVEAESSAREALAAFEEVGDRSGQAWALQNLAWIAFVTGRADLADERVHAAIEIFSDLIDSRGLAWSLGLLSWVRFQQHRVSEAEALGEQVLHEARSRNDPWATAMMTMLSAAIRLWTGRTQEAVELADESRRAFAVIGDAYGLGQANAVLGRAMVMAGQVDEGFALLEDQAASIPTGGMGAGMRWPGSDLVTRATRAATAIQVGEPGRIADLAGELEASTGFSDDTRVMLGLLSLQRGDLAGAAGHLGGDGEHVTNPNLACGQALYAAAAGTGDAGALADRVRSLLGATYFDRALAEVAAALEAVQAGRLADATERIAAARSLVAPTGDVVARAVVELAGAEVARRTGDPDAPHQLVEADRRFANLGIDPVGWVRIIELAVSAVPA